jgi:hypothetical protein
MGTKGYTKEAEEEFILEDGSVDYARIAKMMDIDESFKSPVPSGFTKFALRLDTRLKVRDIKAKSSSDDDPPTLETRCKSEEQTKFELAGPPILQEPESQVDLESPPDDFWEQADKLDGICRKPLEFPASPKKKKKNHARRERREATRKRLAQEKLKEKERQARLLAKAERRARRSLTPKLPRFPLTEDPARIQLPNGHWRLLKCSDMKSYVIRHAPRKIRRVSIQPCWLGKCSPRRLPKQQEKRNVLQFMRFAIKVQIKEKRDLVQEFIDSPYFLRPQQLPSGRATPETSIVWRVEDMIEGSKGTGQ